MNLRRTLALGCHLATALGVGAMGAVYLLSPRFMPYHAQVLGHDWEQVPAEYQRLLLALQHGGGAMALGCALALVVLALVPFRRGERWAAWAIAAIGLTGALPIVAIVWRLKAATGAPVPLQPLLVGVGLVVAGAGLSLLGPRARTSG